MFSKFNHVSQAYQMNNNLVTDANNNVSINQQNVAKINNYNQPQSQSNGQNLNCEIRNMDEEEDDVDSLNINFEDVNEQSDMEEYYNNCADQIINSNNNNNNNNEQMNNNLNKKAENCLYENPQHYMYSPKILSPNKTMNNRINSYPYPSPSNSSSPSTIDSVLTNEIPPIENSFGISNSTKVNTKNIHCVKEKIRRDRIKMSCNQLRKLIPNVNGFKTDMASLLETSVYWAELINTYVPEQYLNFIKSKLGSLASIKNNGQMKSLQHSTSNSNILSQKYKQNYEYFLAKNQHEVLQHVQSEMQNNSQTSSLSSGLNINQFEPLPLDINHTYNSLPASLNLKPNSWLPYSFQLNESNNQNHHHLMAYNEFYDKMIKKSPSNNSFNYER
ncbi:unnamed protein product [Brachionus calyciflorus]|uniref:BHLH domain-containing protein n=1 Tax=Brachionus calyciflorus TaxID=104777 RepID=A0A813YBC6_9BILA|nr:unnamed protein product [Brachionus calyciflorus]